MTDEPRIDESYLRGLVDSRIEESLTLEYKESAALARTDRAKRELTKDVSAIANSAGGRIIIGIREGDGNLRHVPVALDPVSRRNFSKEWLEQVLSGIQPRLDRLVITPVQLSTNEDHVIYVVDVPPSTTAHQAADWRYYRRYNFESSPMHDHEVRDVMNRSKFPELEVALKVSAVPFERHPLFPGMGEVAKGIEYRLTLRVTHVGGPLARFVNGFVTLPSKYVAEKQRGRGLEEKRGGRGYLTFSFDNTERDVIGITGTPPFHTVNKGPSWFSPILPDTSRSLFSIQLDDEAIITGGEAMVEWSIHADSAGAVKGEEPLRPMIYATVHLT